jgi:hypothetical protein
MSLAAGAEPRKFLLRREFSSSFGQRFAANSRPAALECRPLGLENAGTGRDGADPSLDREEQKHAIQCFARVSAGCLKKLSRSEL